MKRLCMSLVLAGLATHAVATGRLANVSIVDRSSGEVLAAHYHRGEYWVAGRPGARYAIRINNRSHERLLAVTAVDGVNVISGETAAWDQTGYVFHGWQGYDIDGWRKSNHDVAAFTFTAAPRSYAARTGRAANIGVVGVALFRERLQQPVPMTAPAAPMAEARERLSDSAASTEAAGGMARQESERAAKLGTGHGERVRSDVQHTDFERRHARPDEIIRIRYDSHENLVAMGVIRRNRPHSPTPEAFPDSPVAGYVPDPPSWR
jgi:hypothetical protein